MGSTSYESNCMEIASAVYFQDASKNLGHIKTKNHTRVIFYLFAGTPHWVDCFEFWHAGSYC